MSGGCLACVLRVSGGCLEGIYGMSNGMGGVKNFLKGSRHRRGSRFGM